MLDKDRIYKEIDKHNIISFDIFDTLILRNVINPTDIFDVVQYVYNNRFPKDKLDEFKQIRIKAENTARKEARDEVTLNEIYEKINLDDRVKKEIKDIEIEVEYAFAVCNPKMRAVYDYALKKGKDIIIVSDMYLPCDFIKSVLKKCGYRDYKNLFVSCEIGKRKRTGEIFAHVIKKLTCKPNQILHIGDNKFSDYKAPKLSGIDAFYVPAQMKSLYHYRDNQFDKDKIQNNAVLSMIFNHKGEFNHIAEFIGYSLLGLPLFCFCKWLNENTKEVHKFFLARDGYLLLKAYEIMFPREKSLLHYLYISRKALRRPNLYNDISYDMFVEQLPGSHEYTANDILDFCFINMDELDSSFKDFLAKLQPVSGRKELLDSKEYRNLFEKIKEVGHGQYKEQFDYFREYLQQEHFGKDSAVIDVGWRGSAQINISNIAADTNIKGYYFGVQNSVSSKYYDHSNMVGYLWNWGENNIAEKCFLEGGKPVFECMFLADEGSTVSYERDKKNNNIIPVRENNESLLGQKLVHQIQQGAIQFIRDFMQISEYLPDINASDASAGIVDFICYPQRSEMIIGDIIVENQWIGYLAKPEEFSHYLLHPKTLFKELYNSNWRIGFIVRMIPTNRMLIRVLHQINRSLICLKHNQIEEG